MRHTRSLLAWAEWLCGERARRAVFEPLVADWQREITEKRDGGRIRYATSLLSGAAAFARSLLWCALTGGGWVPTGRALGAALLALFFAWDFAVATMWVIALETGRAMDLRSIQTQSYLLSIAVIVVPPAILPMAYMLRRDSGSTTRHAITVIVSIAALTAATAHFTSPEALNDYFSSFEVFERQYQRSLANDRAGRVEYPGTAVRQLRGTTTIAQRRELHRRFEAWRLERKASQPPPTWQQRWWRFQPAILALLFGMIGWTLAGLGPPTLMRAWAWWAVMFAAMLALSGTLSTLLRTSIRPPYWLALPVLLACTLALTLASWRGGTRHQAPGTHP